MKLTPLRLLRDSGAGHVGLRRLGAPALAFLVLGAAPVPVTIFALVGGREHLTARGEADCKHAPVAAIYGVRSAMWRVEYRDPRHAEIREMSLTMWRPLAGDAPAQVDLLLETPSATYRIATVEGTEKLGSGSITFKPNQPGGTFDVAGNAADGTRLQLRVVCPRVTSLSAVGG